MFNKYLPLTGLTFLLTITTLSADQDGDIVQKTPEERTQYTGSFREPTGEITLRQALSLALLNNPGLKAFSWEVRASEARTLQAGLFPNPEIAVEVEEFAGSGPRSSFDGAETTLQLSQLIELGGKRSKRKQVASIVGNLSSWDYESARLNTFAGTNKAFIEVLAAQSRLTLAENLFRLSQEVFNAASERVKSGKVSPLEETRTRVSLALNRIEVERAKRELTAARKGLSAMWGNIFPQFSQVSGNLENMPGPPPQSQSEIVIQNPDLDRWEAEIELREAELKLEKANRFPDLTLGAGVRKFNESNDSAGVVGASLPFPLFNRNQGAIAAAQHELARAEEMRRQAEVEIKTTLAQALQSLTSYYFEATSLQKEVLPGAQTAFEAAREGYRQGKNGYLDVLDAQRTLFEVEFQFIDSLAGYHNSLADWERLIGRHANSKN